jgi:hypothetical protein
VAKDSDKRRVLIRRKQELDHAIANSYPARALHVRAEKLRAAAIAVLKKYRGAFAHVEGGPGHSAWESFQARWAAMTVDEIIELSAGWGTPPTLCDVRFGNDGDY